MTTRSNVDLSDLTDRLNDLERARGDRLRRLDAVDDDITDLVRASQRAALRDTVRAIERAITRVGDGTYGLCSGCGQTIPAARLDRCPWAETCVGCADV